MVGIPIPYEQAGLGVQPELKVSPLPSKLLARLHEVPDVFNHESHKKALMLALRERQVKGVKVGQTSPVFTERVHLTNMRSASQRSRNVKLLFLYASSCSC